MQIYITDWWLCPELHLRRPFSLHGSSRLDAMLEAKAKQGVQVQSTQSHIVQHFNIFLSTMSLKPQLAFIHCFCLFGLE